MKRKKILMVSAVIVLFIGSALCIYYYINFPLPEKMVKHYLSLRHNSDYTNVDKQYKEMKEMLDAAFLSYIEKSGIAGIYVKDFKTYKIESTMHNLNVYHNESKNGVRSIKAKADIITVCANDRSNKEKTVIDVEFIVKKTSWNSYNINYIKVLNGGSRQEQHTEEHTHENEGHTHGSENHTHENESHAHEDDIHDTNIHSDE